MDSMDQIHKTIVDGIYDSRHILYTSSCSRVILLTEDNMLVFKTVDIYADDTTCSSCSHYSLGVTELQSNLQLDVDCLSELSLQNHMLLNTDKTKSILVSGKRLRSRLDNSTLDLQLNGTAIGQVTSQKLLGVTLDEELSFGEHVEKLCKKLSKNLDC
jgi:hypothetical protein